MTSKNYAPSSAKKSASTRSGWQILTAQTGCAEKLRCLPETLKAPGLIPLGLRNRIGRHRFFQPQMFARADKRAGLGCRNDADIRFAKTRYQDILTGLRAIQETGVPAQ